MDMARVGKNIADRRKEKGLTQTELAAMVGVTNKAVSKWERGMNYPDIAILEPLAAALDLTVPELLGLAEHTAEKVTSALSEISAEEKAAIKRKMKIEYIESIVICLLLIASQVWASRIFYDNGIFGIAQTLTLGMMSYPGTMIGVNIRHLLQLKKL